MGIDHDPVLGGLAYDIVIVADDLLAVVVLALRKDVAHISALDGIVAILVHKGERILEMALVILCGRGGLVVHYQTDTLSVGILVECRKVEIRIWGDEIEHILLLASEPVFPALVPALDEEAVEAVGCCEVDVAAHILIVGAVIAVRGGLGVVRFAQAHCREVVGI